MKLLGLIRNCTSAKTSSTPVSRTSVSSASSPIFHANETPSFIAQPPFRVAANGIQRSVLFEPSVATWRHRRASGESMKCERRSIDQTLQNPDLQLPTGAAREISRDQGRARAQARDRTRPPSVKAVCRRVLRYAYPARCADQKPPQAPSHRLK